MEKKRGRGRPSVALRIAGGNADMYEKLATDGKRFRSRRSVADATYAFSAAILLSKSSYVIEDLGRVATTRMARFLRQFFANQGGFRAAS